jgi:oxygen-independent coproporphyrinogen-3 oxidase
LDLGVYIHFPWCRKVCPYCDFAVEVGPPPHEDYLAAILSELDSRAPRFAGELASIYVGGGTPSLWRVDCLARTLAAIRARFGEPHEVTIEANPTDCRPETLAAWRAAGVTRVSIGVQSFDADELVVLGRDHRFGDGRVAIAAARVAGFTVSADFILGTPLPGRAPRMPAVEPEVDHLSIYELTIEERTAFGARARAGRLIPLDEEALLELYVATHEDLTSRGFEHYEISSYARPGKRAVHNARYWRGVPYLGLGASAASLWLAPDGGGERATNARSAAEYLRAPGAPADLVRLSPREMAADRAWLGLRTSDGVSEGAIDAPVVTWLLGEGLAERRSDRICPTLRGFLMSDRIAARVIAAL